MKRCAILLVLAVTIWPVTPAAAQATAATETQDEAGLRKTREGIGAAFARGDVAGVMAYHHPEVRKALAYDRVLDGADAVAADLRASFAQVRIEFIENHLESLVIEGDVAIEQARFAVRVTPRDGGAPNIFRGRAQVVYVRYAPSPSGWASLRELVQPMPALEDGATIR
jgi:ketosteroid isomerase-like protein